MQGPTEHVEATRILTGEPTLEVSVPGVVTVGGTGGVTTQVKDPDVAVTPSTSVTLTVAPVTVPCVVGAPVITPPTKLSPPGRPLAE